jgi:hypothetical protein
MWRSLLLILSSLKDTCVCYSFGGLRIKLLSHTHMSFDEKVCPCFSCVSIWEWHRKSLGWVSAQCHRKQLSFSRVTGQLCICTGHTRVPVASRCTSTCCRQRLCTCVCVYGVGVCVCGVGMCVGVWFMCVCGVCVVCGGGCRVHILPF